MHRTCVYFNSSLKLLLLIAKTLWAVLSISEGRHNSLYVHISSILWVDHFMSFTISQCHNSSDSDLKNFFERLASRNSGIAQ